jgi:outer membrane lipopolysaccharide assembly protein LptE/RlpB
MILNKYQITFKVVVITLMSSLLLIGCGFKPRGSGYESLEGLQITLFSENPFGELERSIKTTLAAYSVKVETSTALYSLPVTEVGNQNGNQNGNQYGNQSTYQKKDLQKNAIQITDIKFQKNILSVDISGRPAEYETLITVDVSYVFEGSTQQKIQTQQFSAQRDYRYDKNNTLADDRELEKLVSEMYDDLGKRIVAQFSRLLITN